MNFVKRAIEEKINRLSDDINLVNEMPDSTRQQKKSKALEWLKILKKMGHGLLE